MILRWLFLLFLRWSTKDRKSREESQDYTGTNIPRNRKKSMGNRPRVGPLGRARDGARSKPGVFWERLFCGRRSGCGFRAPGARIRHIGVGEAAMRRSVWLGMAGLAGAAMMTAVGARGQEASDSAAFGAAAVPVAPVPAALLSAKKVFVSNAGADSGLFPHPFSGGTERGYNEFYGALQGWGRLELVGDPQEADLVLELQLVAPTGPKDADKQKGSSDPLPMFRLTIFDRKTHYVLWTLTESIHGAYGQKSHDKKFDEAMGALIGDLKSVMGRSVAAAG